MLSSIFLFSCLVPQARTQEATRGRSSRQDPQRLASSTEVTRSQGALRIPFELSGHHIFLQCRVNGSEPLWFLLDSGASLSIIDDRRARNLRLEQTGRDLAGSIGEPAQISYVNNVSLELLGAKLAPQVIATAPLDLLESVAGRSVDGILGYELFKDYVVEINYEARIIILLDSNAFSYSGSGEILPLEIENNLPYIQAAVVQPGADNIVGRFVIGTGASDALTLNKPFAETYQLLKASGKMVQAMAAGLGGESKMIATRIANLQIGNLIIKDPITAVSQDEVGDLSKTEFAGLIGGELLRRFDVFYDYGHRRLILQPNSYFNEPYEYDMSGMSLGGGMRFQGLQDLLASRDVACEGSRAS